jgi:hypothetical protein
MKYEWAVVGGGVAGIVLSEILTREGHSVVLIEKGEKLAGETTKIFHEWIHTGSLYTLIPDKLTTLKFLLGAVDDLLEYYSCFERMNLSPTESGLDVGDGPGWFSPNYIQFKFKRRKLNLPWCLGSARSTYLINKIKEHDWLRRRGGVIDEFKEGMYRSALKTYKEILKGKEAFHTVETPDFTTNSRHILRDLIATAMHNGLDLSLGNPVIKIEDHNGKKNIITEKATFSASKVIVCAGKNISDFMDVGVKTSIAPIAVVTGLKEQTKSFVELDYFPKNCINLVTKPGGAGLIGGISLDSEEKAQAYIGYVIEQHKARNKDIKVVDTYFGYKNEIVFKDQDRNYLFHIVPTAEGIWAVVPGKFTLGFSLAAEFYRRIYKKNPRKVFKTVTDTGEYSHYVYDTLWYELINQKDGEQNGTH